MIAESKLVDDGTSDDEVPLMIDALIRNGRSNPNLRNEDGCNAFHIAAIAGNLRFYLT